MQEEELNLHEELGHLQLAIEDERQKAKKIEVKLHAKAAKSYKINQQLNIANGKIMGYQTQLTEMQYKGNQMQKDHTQEIEKITWEKDADLKAKDLQIEALQRAHTLMQQRLKQAEEVIDKYMANPILDPTTERGKDSQIKRLTAKVEMIKDMNIDLNQGFKSRLKHKDDKIAKLKKQVAQLQARGVQGSAQGTPSGQPTIRPLALGAPIEFERLDQNQPGTSSRFVEEESEEEQEEEGQRRAPPISKSEKELRRRMAQSTDDIQKDCMEWERRILHSTCITLLTPSAVRASYHLPTLPFPLLKLEVELLKQTLLPQCLLNEMGGYQQVPIKDYEVMDIERNQPRWRQTWFTRNPMHKLHYVNAPQDLNIDPTFYPIHRRRD